MEQRIFQGQLWVNIFAQLANSIVQARYEALDFGKLVAPGRLPHVVTPVNVYNLVGAASGYH